MARLRCAGVMKPESRCAGPGGGIGTGCRTAGIIRSTVASISGVCISTVRRLLLLLLQRLLLLLLLIVTIVMLRYTPLFNGSASVRIIHHWRSLRGSPLSPTLRLMLWRPFNTPTRPLMGKTDGLRLTPSPSLWRRIRLTDIEWLRIHGIRCYWRMWPLAW